MMKPRIDTVLQTRVMDPMIYHQPKATIRVISPFCHDLCAQNLYQAISHLS
jgi:poly(A) polymerase Pap1